MSLELEQPEMKEVFEQLIATDDKLAIQDFLNDQNISDVAELINEYPDYEAQIIANMAINRAASVFKILDFSQQKDIVKELPTSKTAELLNELPADDRKKAEETLLYNYIFEWGEGHEMGAVGLGYISIYNHSYKPNCSYQMDFESELMTITAIHDIAIGEELFINYNAEPDNQSPIWFEAE